MKKITILLFVLFWVGCKDKYDIVLRSTDVSLLVVEGVLDAGTGPTTITLSKTIKVNDRAVFKPELKAKVSVENRSGNSISLAESANGNYINNNLGLVQGQEYRLRIKTSNNKEYLSDYVVAKEAPPIDSITWNKNVDGVMIYANSHDASNKTRYYKWDFDETWEIHSYFPAEYEWIGGSTIVPSAYTYWKCWKYGSSHTINVGSSAQLVSDVISQSPIVLIPNGSEKISVRYSILLRQQALTKEAYDFYELMKKNTESIGTIFDPQPSDLRGNIKCISNPEEGVIGFITASTITQKRIFITAGDANWSFLQNCNTERVANKPEDIRQWVPYYLPYGAEYSPTGSLVAYYFAPATCVDCTKRGGSIQKPSYW